MKIDKIKKLKSGKYKLEIDKDNKLITYDDVILNNNLLFNKEINNDVLNKLNIETKFYDIYYKCIKYISIKMRSKLEINNYLDKIGVDEIDKNRIIIDLERIGLINDLSFAKAFISDKINLSNIGPNRIKNELLNHNIDINLIEENLSKYENSVFEEKIEKYILKKNNTTKYSNYYFKQKMLNELLNLGYDYDMIVEKLKNINTDEEHLLEKDYDKIYNNLSKKYEGKILKNKISSKLYQKGYKLDDINNFIENRID